jgi:hypothetical protein
VSLSILCLLVVCHLFDRRVRLSGRILWRLIYKPALLDLVLIVILVPTAEIVDTFIHLLNRLFLDMKGFDGFGIDQLSLQTRWRSSLCLARQFGGVNDERGAAGSRVVHNRHCR